MEPEEERPNFQDRIPNQNQDSKPASETDAELQSETPPLWGAAGWGVLWLAAAAVLVFWTGALQSGESIGGARALTQGVLAGRDTLAHDYPAAWWGWRQVRENGELPFWNPCWFGGGPFIASQTFLPFYPPNWLMGVLAMPLGFNLQYPLHLLVAAATMGWTCRRRGLGWWAAGLAGLSWGFGGHLATLVGPGHLQKLQALSWMPLVVYGLGRIGGAQPGRGAVPLALGLTMQVLAGHLQIVYLSLAAGGAEFLARSAQWGMRNRIRNPESGIRNESEIQNPDDRTKEGPYSALAAKTLALAGAVGLAALLSAVLWMPTVEFAGMSNRQGALAWTDAVRGSLPPEEAFEVLLPRARGDSMPRGRGGYVGRMGASPTSSAERMTSDYAGTGTFAFAMLGLVFAGRRRGALGWWLLAAVGVTLSMGGYLGDIYRVLLKIVPGLARFRSPSTMMALTAFGMAMAAGVGLEGLMTTVKERKENPKRSDVVWRILSICIAAGLLMYWSERAARMHEMTSGPANRGILTAHMLMQSMVHTLRALLACVVASSFVVVVAGTGRRGVLAVNAGMVALSAAWGTDLVVNARPFWNAVEAAPYEAYMRNHWAMGAWEKDAAEGRGPVRIHEVGGELKNWALTYTDYERGRVISAAHGYHPLAYIDYFRLLDGLDFTHPNFLKLMAVRWVLWPEWADAQGRARPAGYREVGAAAGLRLLHNPQTAFVWPAGPLHHAASREDLRDWLRDPDNDPYARTVVVEEDAAGEQQHEFGDETFGEFRYRVWPMGPGDLLIDYEAAGSGRAIVSEPAAPGWRAWLSRGDEPESAAIRIERAFGYVMLLGPLPEGRGHVRLAYDPASQRLGLYLTTWGLFIIGWRIGRRKGSKSQVRISNGN
jgi:hypothetical protein